MADYIVYRTRVSVITPLHIGSGNTLLHEYDYAIHEGRTWRIDEFSLLDAQDVDNPRMAEHLASTPPVQLLQPGDFKEDGHLFRYIIQGTPRSAAEGAEVQEQLKDYRDCPYLPGTSLKGALRTALAWHGWKQKNLKLDIAKLDRRREWAAQNFERDIFGATPNKSLLRALHVGDSQSVPADALMLLNVRVVNIDGKLSAPIELEAIRPDTIFESQMKFDWALFSEWARKQGLNLSGGEWLKSLGHIVNQHAQDRIAHELHWYKTLPNGGRLASFYERLSQSEMGEGRFLLQLGWGTGWEDKTLGSRLQANADFMERLIKDYRLTRGRRQRGDPFPKSRRVAMAYTRNPQGKIVGETPAYPLGWVLVEMTEKR
ncbi:MAG: type III-A CRISPR-associated RAMP protein Csm5 [Chloroflexota bacterium]